MGAQNVTQELLDRQATIVADTNSNTLLISATPRNFPDQPPGRGTGPTSAPSPHPGAHRRGLAHQGQRTGRELELFNPRQSQHQDRHGPRRGQRPAGLPGGFGSAISGNRFNFLFRAFQSEDRLHVFSRPEILTSDNQQATLPLARKCRW